MPMTMTLHPNHQDIAKHTVLLHRLARTAYSMRTLAQSLQANADMVCHNLAYPSRRHDIATLARQFVLPQINALPSVDYYVTHSMGGIVLRYLLQHDLIAPPQAIVMLAPPNAGSEIVDKLGHWRAFGWLNGAAGRELGTGADSMPNRLNAMAYALPCPVGVIIGNRSRDPLRYLLPSANDGKVTLASSRLAGADFLVLPVGHTFMMNNQALQRQVRHFLQYGGFRVN